LPKKVVKPPYLTPEQIRANIETARKEYMAVQTEKHNAEIEELVM
jgi:hypothetical protein